MSCEYFGNLSRGSSRGNHAGSNSRTSSGRGGRAYQAPPTPNQQHQQQQWLQPPPNFGQQQHQNPEPGFVPYANAPMGGGYGNVPPPPYYSGGYIQGPTYASFGGSQSQPTMQPNPMGWGEHNVFAPPTGWNQPGPSRRYDEAMEIDDPAPPQQGQTRQGCVRPPRREEPRRHLPPARPAGPYRLQATTGTSQSAPSIHEGQKRRPAPNAVRNPPVNPKGKGKARATEADLVEQEQEDRAEQLRELLQRLDAADVDPTLADFLKTDEIAQVVVGRLLDTIDDLREGLEKAKRGQRDAETRLI
jgi:hypothetical protein